MQKGAYAKAFLSDASQPEIRPFPVEYALTLPNFVLLSVSTLKRDDFAKTNAQECNKSTSVAVRRSKTELLCLSSPFVAIDLQNRGSSVIISVLFYFTPYCSRPPLLEILRASIG